MAIKAFLRQDAGPQKLVSRTTYCEAEKCSSIFNLRSRIVSHQDHSGIKHTDRYDFKGNSLNTSRQMAEDFASLFDWSCGKAPLEDEFNRLES